MGFTSSGCVNFLFLPECRTSRDIWDVSRSKWLNIASIGSSQAFYGDSSDSFKRHFLSWFIRRLWVILVPGQYRPVRQSFPECHVVFIGLEKNFIARIEMFLMGWDDFLELRLPRNEFIEDGLDFSCEHCFWFRKFVLRVAIMEPSKTSVFLRMSRDQLSAWQIFLDVRNSILKLQFKRIVPQRSSLFAV